MRHFSFLALALWAVACNSGKNPGTGGTDSQTAVNNKPVAEAGNNLTLPADQAVALNGGASRDPDGDALTYIWSFDHVPDGSVLPAREAPFSQNNGGTPTTSFTPDAVGTFVVKLMVRDARGMESDPDFIVVTIEDPTTLPVANAGTDLVTMIGSAVSMSGAASYDPQGRSFTYSWSVIDHPANSTATLTGADTVSPSLTPDIKGVYVVNLVVNNGLATSHGDAVTITALADDHAPVANAGTDIETEDCTTIQLDCSSSSDPDGDALQYQWELQSKPADSRSSNDSFSNRTSARPTFYPDAAGDYIISCAAYDGATWSTPDLMHVTADDRRVNSAPAVNAGPNEITDGGSALCAEQGYSYDCDACADLDFQLGLSASVTDADGDPYTILWEVLEGEVEIVDPTSLVTMVRLKEAEPTEPGSCEENDYTLRLTSTDCTGESDSDTIVITVNCCGIEDTAN